MMIKTQYPVKIIVRFDKIDFELLGICGLCEFIEDKSKIIIDISRNYGPEYIVHEISHCIDFLEEHIEQKLDTESKAYLFQFLFKKIHKKYTKSN